MFKFKKLYLQVTKLDSKGRVLQYSAMHPQGYKIDIILNREPGMQAIMVYDITFDRIILEDRLTKDNFKKALYDINNFYNNRKLRYKMF